MKSAIILTYVFLIIITSCSSDTDNIFAYGNFEAEEIIISAENTGKVLWQDIEEGMLLKTDNLVLITDTFQFHLTREELTAAVQTVNLKIRAAGEQIIAGNISISNLEREQERLLSLFKEGAATAKQIDDINGQLDLLNAQNRVYETSKQTIFSELESLRVKIKQIEDQIKRCYVYPPADGIVLGKYINKGELAVQGRALFKMADVNVMILRVYISGDQLSEIKHGDIVTVNVASSNGDLKSYEGVVTWISDRSEFTPKIIQTRDERVNLVYPVKMMVKNDGYLKIGMPADITLSVN